MCSPAAASFGSGAINAIGGAMSASAENKARKRDYEYKLKVRENRWMRERSTYQTSIVNYKTNLSETNLAAQRAYTQSQINYNNVRVRAMLDHSEDFKSMLKAEGLIQAQAAERGVRGASVQRMISSNLGEMGLANQARARALTQTQYRFNEANQNVARQARSKQNQMFGKVAISPVQDIPPPPPVLKNVGATLFLGLAGAGFDAAGAHYSSKAGSIG